MRCIRLQTRVFKTNVQKEPYIIERCVIDRFTYIIDHINSSFICIMSYLLVQNHETFGTSLKCVPYVVRFKNAFPSVKREGGKKA